MALPEISGISDGSWMAGNRHETILDVNEGNLSLSNRYIISEGGIYIKA